jgi:hypothetical protein
MADIKGDLSGLSRPGEADDKTEQRAKDTGDAWTPTAFPGRVPVSRHLGNRRAGARDDDQLRADPVVKGAGAQSNSGVTLGLIFHWADQKGLRCWTSRTCGPSSSSSPATKARKSSRRSVRSPRRRPGVILRALINLEAEGADTFFGEPELEPSDLMRVDAQGRGIITLLELGDQAARPVMFSTFLMWVLADLFTALPEVGDVDKPKLVFIFDEAHLLFTDASKAFLEQVEQTVKLIRSKGVGVFFCTQLPTDVPNDVLSQLGARIQHALRAFTPDDRRRSPRRYAPTRRPTVYDLEKALTSLGIGEAIVTVLSEKGAPTPVAVDQDACAALADGQPSATTPIAGGSRKASPLQASTARRSAPAVGLRDPAEKVALRPMTLRCRRRSEQRCQRRVSEVARDTPSPACREDDGSPAFKSACARRDRHRPRDHRSIFGTAAAPPALRIV